MVLFLTQRMLHYKKCLRLQIYRMSAGQETQHSGNRKLQDMEDEYEFIS